MSKSPENMDIIKLNDEGVPITFDTVAPMVDCINDCSRCELRANGTCGGNVEVDIMGALLSSKLQYNTDSDPQSNKSPRLIKKENMFSTRTSREKRRSSFSGPRITLSHISDIGGDVDDDEDAEYSGVYDVPETFRAHPVDGTMDSNSNLVFGSGNVRGGRVNPVVGAESGGNCARITVDCSHDGTQNSRSRTGNTKSRKNSKFGGLNGLPNIVDGISPGEEDGKVQCDDTLITSDKRNIGGSGCCRKSLKKTYSQSYLDSGVQIEAPPSRSVSMVRECCLVEARKGKGAFASSNSNAADQSLDNGLGGLSEGCVITHLNNHNAAVNDKLVSLQEQISHLVLENERLKLQVENSSIGSVGVGNYGSNNIVGVGGSNTISVGTAANDGGSRTPYTGPQANISTVSVLSLMTPHEQALFSQPKPSSASQSLTGSLVSMSPLPPVFDMIPNIMSHDLTTAGVFYKPGGHIDKPRGEWDVDYKKNIFSMKEIAKHNLPDNCWLVVRDIVYDVSTFLPNHPAGVSTICKFGGTIVDRHYDFHPRLAQKLWDSFAIGIVEGSTHGVCTIM